MSIPPASSAFTLSDRLNEITMPSFKQLTDLAARYQAIDLGGGKPDFPTEPEFKAAAIQAIENNHNQYAPAYGLDELLRKISRRFQQKYNAFFDPEQEITICSGVAEGLAAIFLALLNPGDEVIVLTPAFQAYTGNVRMAGGNPVYVKLSQPGFTLDPQQLEAAVTSRTRAIFLNTPHNPSGRVFTRGELQGLADVCLKYNLLVISDEIYDEIYFGSQPPFPIWQLPGMRERTIIANGFSKTYSVTGWRLGYVIAPPALSAGFRKAHNLLAGSSVFPLQWGVSAALDSAEDYYVSLRKAYAARLAILREGLDTLAVPYIAPEGGYFLLADFSQQGWNSDLEFTAYLTEHIGVSAHPLSGFYPDSRQAETKIWLRLAFCKQEPVLRQAAERLKALKEAVAVRKST